MQKCKCVIYNLELNWENFIQENPFLVVATGDFNAKSSNWFSQDKTRFEGDPIKKFNIPIRNTSGY